jgi:hypothetical protein
LKLGLKFPSYTEFHLKLSPGYVVIEHFGVPLEALIWMNLLIVWIEFEFWYLFVLALGLNCGLTIRFRVFMAWDVTALLKRNLIPRLQKEGEFKKWRVTPFVWEDETME